MARMRLWDTRKNDDYYFVDEQIRDMFYMGGMDCFVHKYVGVYDQGDTGDPSIPSNASSTKKGILQIQDLFFLENRDRAYDEHVYQLCAVHNVMDTEYETRAFGMFLDSDTMYLEFHINETLEKIGRKLMTGDVLEFPHLRDDMLLDETKPAVNKYFVVQDVSRAGTGWSAVWRPHIFRVKVKPMTDSQEFSDILDRDLIDGDGEDTGFNLRDIISDFRDQIMISDALVEAAEQDVMYRNFETIQFYVVKGDEMGSQYPWIFAGDGEPPNGAELAFSGNSFPEGSEDGDWFLHTGMEPNVLYQYVATPNRDPLGNPIPNQGGGVWHRREVDFRKKWQAAHRILETFINNDNKNVIGGDTYDEKIMLSKAIKPRADF